MDSSQQSQNLLLTSLPAADFDLLRSNLQTIDMPRGLLLVRSGDIPKKAYFPKSGVIASCVTLGDGSFIEVRITGREGALGATIGGGERPSFTSALVRLEGQTYTIDYPCLERAISRSAALRAVLARHEAVQQAMSDQSVACNVAHVTEARLARRLLRLYAMSGQTSFVATQEVLAEMLGIRRNAVSLVAHAMQEANLIRYSRGRLEIVDLDGLQRRACECYGAVTAFRDKVEVD